MGTRVQAGEVVRRNRKNEPTEGIVLTATTAKKADAIVQREVKKAIEILEKRVDTCRTTIELKLALNDMRTRGGLGFEPVVKGVQVSGKVSDVQPNSVLQATVRTQSGPAPEGPRTLQVQLASDNLMKAGVKILSAKQIADAVFAFASNPDAANFVKP